MFLANCPKCGEHLKLTDWKQKCPHCGTNVVIYDLQERLMQDADKAEVQYYHFQKKIDRLKASFVGTKLSIVRIVTSIIPLLGLLVSCFKINIGDVLKTDFSIIAIVNLVNDLGDETVDALMKVLGLDGGIDIGKLLAMDGVLPLVVAALGLVLSIVMLLVHLILLILACSPKAKVRGIIINGIMLLDTAVFVGALFFLPKSGVITGSIGIGAFLYLALMIVNSVIDFIVLKKGTPVHHKQCYCGGIPIEEYFAMLDNGATHDEIRAEQYKRLAEEQARKEAEIAAKEAEKAAKEGEVTSNG